jgi:formate dehydrogenase subunit delta
MNTGNLVKMANQIGAFFEAMPDREEAVSGVANHIRNTWDRRMREALLQHLAAHEEAGLKSVVRDAVALLRQG